MSAPRRGRCPRSRAWRAWSARRSLRLVVPSVVDAAELPDQRDLGAAGAELLLELADLDLGAVRQRLRVLVLRDDALRDKQLDERGVVSQRDVDSDPALRMLAVAVGHELGTGLDAVDCTVV